MNKNYYLSLVPVRSGFLIFLKKNSQTIDKLGSIVLKKNYYYISIHEQRLDFWVNCNIINFAVSFPDLIVSRYLNCKLKHLQLIQNRKKNEAK